MLRIVFNFLARAYRMFGACLAFAQGLWLGSLFPQRIADLVLLAVMGTLIIDALFFGLRTEHPGPVRLAGHTTAVMLSAGYALLVYTLMPVLMAKGTGLVVLLSIAFFLPVGACGLAALVSGLKTIRDLVASRHERTRFAF